MTEKIVQRIVDLFVGYGFIEEEQKETYDYSLLCFVESCIIIGSIILISLMVGRFRPTVFFCVYFFSLRSHTGGVHFNSFIKCFIASLLLFILVVFCCDVVVRKSRLILWIMTISSALIVWKIGAVNNININMSVKEIAATKRAARLVLGMEMCLLAFLECTRVEFSIIAFSCCGIILCAILLIIAKLIGQEVIMCD